MLVLSHMSPWIEAYRRFPAPSISWCTPGPFPLIRNRTPQPWQDCFKRVIENIEEGYEMAQELVSEMPVLQAKNARLLQQSESITVAYQSIREATTQQNLRNSRLE